MQIRPLFCHDIHLVTHNSQYLHTPDDIAVGFAPPCRVQGLCGWRCERGLPAGSSPADMLRQWAAAPTETAMTGCMWMDGREVMELTR